MGTGIMAAVPLVFEPYTRYGRQERIEEKYFTKGFLDNFDIEEKESGIKYVIKKDLLLNNYKQFLLEFYDLIEEDFKDETKLDRDNIPDANSFDEFLEVFSGRKRNNRVPFIYDPYMLSVFGCRCEEL